MSQTGTEQYASHLSQAIETLEVALPRPDLGMDQDEEWIVAKTEGNWRKIRLHDYDKVYAVQGLYEKWIYDIFGCRSPQKVAGLLMPVLHDAGLAAEDLSVLDLGAGNGYVADVLRAQGVERFVGIDIHDQAAEAAERDRPGLYSDYLIGDLTDLPDDQETLLAQHSFNCLTCVAALGFGDIPPGVFAAAYNRIEDDGWAAFTIKTDFMSEDDRSGFSTLIRRMLADGVMDARVHKPFVHRKSTDGDELVYEAFVGQKISDIPESWL